MDTLTPTIEKATVNINDKLALIKREMPITYAAIQDWAGRVGGKAFEQVRRGLRGEYRCFWAHENGHTVGEVWYPDFATECAVRHERFGSAVVDVRLGSGVQDGAN